MYVIPRTFLQCLCFEYENQTPAAILVALAKFPFFIVWERTPKFLPKRTDPLPPPPPQKKRKLTCMITKKRCSVVLVDCFPFLLGEYPVFCGLSLHQGNMRSRKNPEQQFILFFFFSFPTNVKLYPFHSDTLFLFFTSMTSRY